MVHQTRLIPVVVATDALVLVLFVDRGRKNACATLLERFRRESGLQNENGNRREGEIGWYEKGACPQTVSQRAPRAWDVNRARTGLLGTVRGSSSYVRVCGDLSPVVLTIQYCTRAEITPTRAR
jgi:hypothetical protein